MPAIRSSPRHSLIATVTLLVMVGINVWGSKQLKLYAILIGLVVGFGLSLGLGVLTSVDLRNVTDARWIGLPSYDGMWSYSFRWSLVPLFVIVSICGALKSFGNLVLCEKANDSDWKQPDVNRIGDGLVADGIAVAVSGVLGGVASDTSASNVALSIASGATSRSIALGAGGLFCLLGLSPKLTALLAIMPSAVAGAILVLVVCFMMISGIQIILSAQMDTPRTFVIGIALIFGMSLDVSAGVVFAHLFVDAAVGRIVAHALDGSGRRHQPAVADRLEAIQGGRERRGGRDGAVTRIHTTPEHPASRNSGLRPPDRDS